MQFVSYVRVSTQRQGESGLGLEAQREAVARYMNGWIVHHPELIGEFQEIESGKRNDRPVLKEALALCKRTGATLVIAKLDRLARNVAFIANLMESDVEFVCCDLPQANRLLLHIMAAVAENEARMISERTKSALAAAKARGTKLGAANPACQNLTEGARDRGTEASAHAAVAAAREAYAPIVPKIRSARAAGMSWHGVAALLNESGHKTRSGARFSGPIARRIFMREETVAPAA